MPRADSKLIAAQHQRSPYPSQGMADPLYVPSSSNGLGHRTIARAGSSPSPPPKKKHVCPTCDRSFSTSGHLARHSRIHTGERNHKCPFPGCETRCSRQDNLQQHYRIHFSPGSRRSRANVLRSKPEGNVAKNKRSVSASDGYSSSSSSSTPALEVAHTQAPHSPPPLEPARLYPQSLSPPDSPPPLAHATLPATAQMMDGSSRASSQSPSGSFSVPNGLIGAGSTDLHQYHYRSSGGSYQDSHPVSYPFDSSVSGTQTPVNDSPSPYSTSYPSPQQEYSMMPLPSRDASPVSSSLYSSYGNGSSAGPSTSSSQSLSMHFPSQSSTSYYEDGQSSNSHSVVVQDGYVSNGRFGSASPKLAPIQGRYVRHERSSSSVQQYIHHPQPLQNEFGYHQPLSMPSNVWKPESPMIRKGFAALVQ